MKKRICIDQDDVLANTHAKLVRLYLASGNARHESDALATSSFHELLTEAERDDIYRQIHQPGFFADIAVMPGAQEAVIRLQEQIGRAHV